MHRSIRTCFNASVVTLLALVVPACGGNSKPSPVEPLRGEALDLDEIER